MIVENVAPIVQSAHMSTWPHVALTLTRSAIVGSTPRSFRCTSRCVMVSGFGR